MAARIDIVTASAGRPRRTLHRRGRLILPVGKPQDFRAEQYVRDCVAISLTALPLMVNESWPAASIPGRLDAAFDGRIVKLPRISRA